MPDIRFPRGSIGSIRGRATELVEAAVEWARGDAAVAFTVAGLAFALSVIEIQLQYVAGAIGIVFARRLVSKKIAPTVYVQEKDGAGKPVREFMASRGVRVPPEGQAFS